MQSFENLEPTSVKFRFKNIGPVKEAGLELGDLSIIAGRNNTGKTYLAYALYGFLRIWKEWPGLTGDFFLLDPLYVDIARLIGSAVNEGYAKRKVDRETLNRERKELLQTLTRAFSEGVLPSVFSSSQSAFQGASIEVEIGADFPAERNCEFHRAGGVFSIQYDGVDLHMTCSKQEERRVNELWLSEFYLQFLFPELSFVPFVLSAERFGISLFYKELDFTKNRLVELLQQMGGDKGRESFSPFLLIDSAASRYALPIKDHIDYTRGISDLQTEKSEIFEDKLFDDIKDMMEGYYRGLGDDIQFRSKARKERSFNIPLHRASSSARGLSDLYFFLRHVAKKDHLLIVDEPESHLDTANQIEFARLMARLARAGVKVLITTHSDYIIKEINNLIMLSQSFEDKNKMVKKLKYKKSDFLPAESVRAYVAEDSSLTPCKIDEFGIDMPFFDKTINDINRASNELATRVAREGVE